MQSLEKSRYDKKERISFGNGIAGAVEINDNMMKICFSYFFYKYPGEKSCHLQQLSHQSKIFCQF